MIKELIYSIKQKLYLKKIHKKAVFIKNQSNNINVKNFDNELFNNDDKLIMAYIVKKIKDIQNKDIHLEQIIGALVLLDKNAIEMKTGEGKTFVALIAALTYSLKHNKQVTIVTVNDYLASRDSNDNKNIIEFFNKKVGFIDKNNQDSEYKKSQYSCDIIYASASELGYDYLRDNLVLNFNDKVQNEHNFVIIDEIDSVLIDEANQPLSIVGQKALKNIDYAKYISIKNNLIENTHYTCDYDTKQIEFMELGYDLIDNKLGVKNIFENDEHVFELNYIVNCLYIDKFIKKEKEYIVENDIIVPIDSNGRKAYGQRFKSEVQQILEYIENIPLSNESEIIAEITYQNYFKMYNILTGMSGTLKTEEHEFAEMYNLEIVNIPRHFHNNRKDESTYIFANEEDKIEYLINYVKSVKNGSNNPILIGTSNIQDNTFILNKLKDNNIEAISLSARDSADESEIIKQAGTIGSIVVATNIAGRGVDIKLDEDSKKAGGLIIIGYSRNITRRLDDQLIGRGGRQGDPGKSLFLLSLDDTLVKDYSKGAIKKLILNIMNGEKYIQSEYIDKQILKIQQNIEDLYFEARASLLKFDNVIKTQRDNVYTLRNNIMQHDNIVAVIDNNIIYILDNIFGANEYIETEELTQLFKENNLNLLFKSELKEVNKYTVHQMLIGIVSNKFKGYDKTVIYSILKEIYLNIIDKEWASSINKLEELRMGINLRAIGSKDTNIEFQKDAFFIYNKMINDIKINVLNVLINIELKKDEEIKEITLKN